MCLIIRHVAVFATVVSMVTSWPNVSENIEPIEKVSRVLTIPAIPHPVVKERRRLEQQEDNTIPKAEESGKRRSNHKYLKGNFNAALYEGYGTHYVDLYVGTPPQRQTLILDTGSGVTGFPCSNCSGCGHSSHTDDYFNETASDTFQKLDCDNCLSGYCHSDDNTTCKVSIHYQGDSSWSAFEATDYVYLGNSSGTPEKEEINRTSSSVSVEDGEEFRFPLTFGCQNRINGQFKMSLADGIMGLENSVGALFKQMKFHGAIEKEQFALCFARQGLEKGRGTIAGALTLGGVDKRLHYDPMVFAEQLREEGSYTVKLRKVYLRAGGGESIFPIGKLIPLDLDKYTLNTGGVILDTGATESFFNHKYRDEFRRVWKHITGTNFEEDISFTLTDEQLYQLPTIVFQLYGTEGGEENKKTENVVGLAGSILDPDHPTDVIIAMTATHYLEYDPTEGTFTPKINFQEQGSSILGSNFMAGHDVLFDVENRRIGFAESHCDYHQLVNDNQEDSVLYPGNPLRYNQPQVTSQQPKNKDETPRKGASPFAVIVAALGSFLIGLSMSSKIQRNRKHKVRYGPPSEAFYDIDLSGHSGEEDFYGDEKFTNPNLSCH